MLRQKLCSFSGAMSSATWGFVHMNQQGSRPYLNDQHSEHCSLLALSGEAMSGVPSL
jgi:hypothetical protein|uniref:Uncharacterized protein n=1 Tax=Picea glauca TaxID=3330 RepID=A0A101LWZ0_PICGL|nr:hypothetical protein ABT39_MTgene6324 [Picea glauca]